jgi:Domain of Unknown Function (DUF1543)
MTHRLFAVFLGGVAPKCNTELHDVVFVTGPTIESTYEQIMDKWFGEPLGLHLDSWVEIDIVDGYKVKLTDQKPQSDQKLFFINLGAYSEGVFAEAHANKFLVTTDLQMAKRRGKSELFTNWTSPVHTDDLYEVDDCLAIDKVGSYFVTLEKTDQPENFHPTNGYHLIPKSIVEDYIARKMQSRQ